MSYKEIYNIHAYFSGPSPSMLKALNATHPNIASTHSSYQMGPQQQTPGDEALQRIARAGRKWKNTIARKVDMEGVMVESSSVFLDIDFPFSAYVYRLCLEYARLWADDREAFTYRPKPEGK
jgi:hypothetical protein